MAEAERVRGLLLLLEVVHLRSLLIAESHISVQILIRNALSGHRKLIQFARNVRSCLLVERRFGLRNHLRLERARVLQPRR